ncbi:hypothetical protein Hamer_G025987, partial [Homarus americanus]
WKEGCCGGVFVLLGGPVWPECDQRSFSEEAGDLEKKKRLFMVMLWAIPWRSWKVDDDNVESWWKSAFLPAATPSALT